jgi:hypothetical protein
MSKLDGSASDAAAPPPPNFGERPDIFARLGEYAADQIEIGVEEAPVTLSVTFDKPGAQEWVRSHPDRERILFLDCIRDAGTKRLLVVNHALKPVIGHQIRRFRVTQAVASTGKLYLWPAPADGRMESDRAHLNAQQASLTSWVRLEWRDDQKTYLGHTPIGDLGEPSWPDTPFGTIVNLALEGRMVDDDTHPFIRRLLGYA